MHGGLAFSMTSMPRDDGDLGDPTPSVIPSAAGASLRGATAREKPRECSQRKCRFEAFSRDPAGSATYTYDNLGRMASETRVIAGVSKPVSYEYNLDGSIFKLHYPSNRVVTYTPDAAGRIISAADGNGTQYVSSATYYASGSEYQRSMPGIYFRNDLNPRLQVSGFYSDNGVVSSYFMN